MCKWIRRIFQSKIYGSELEAYIVSRNPQSTADVDRLTIEYSRGVHYYGFN